MVDNFNAAGGIATVPAEDIASSAPVIVGKVQRRGHQSRYINPSALAKQYAILVKQPNLAVAAQTSQNRGRVIAHHPVKHLTAGIDLIETDGVLSAD